MSDIKKKIEQLIECEYIAYGFKVRGDVTINNNGFTICVNRETPYLGEEFWNLINSLHEKIAELGYRKEKSECIDSYYFGTYSK